MPDHNLPEGFRRTVRGAFPEGAAWLESLPSLIEECERRWHVRIAEESFELSFNYVAPALTAQGRDVVVKIGVPRPELESEIRTLRVYAGGAAVELLDADEQQGMLLLERVRPASKLSDAVDDDQATVIAARVMRDLWRPLPAGHTFPAAAHWAAGLRRLRRRFDGGTGPFDARLVETAEALFEELPASAAPAVLVHGDLHHFNILSATRRSWLAIDPKGLAAEPAYDVGALLRNPSPDLYLNSAVQQRRVELLAAELGLDRHRVAGWGVAQAVLSAWWHYEEGGAGWGSAVACAETLMRLLP
ncbi:MAG TPA: aminoglycoside phosphotransferase family protein [bacterium]|nr:aminoglycoside phosphotransferase family protein [bacterium]